MYSEGNIATADTQVLQESPPKQLEKMQSGEIRKFVRGNETIVLNKTSRIPQIFFIDSPNRDQIIELMQIRTAVGTTYKIDYPRSVIGSDGERIESQNIVQIWLNYLPDEYMVSEILEPLLEAGFIDQVIVDSF